MLTQQALGKSYPDKFRVIKHKWNSLLFQGNEKEIPAHLCSISNLIALFFYSQAGKHRLFLNILLFGKLHFPTWISPAAIHHTVLQALPATFLFLFLFDINCLWIPYIFLISWWLYSISFYAVLPYFIHSKSATTGSKTAFCSFFWL